MSNNPQLLQAQSKFEQLVQLKNTNEVQLLKVKCEIKEQKMLLEKLRRLHKEQQEQERIYNNREQLVENSKQDKPKRVRVNKNI